jgi:prolyl-tRNA editing enzyme YbaK/EbsC (Cys-tRNA(Pro) deacylase)
MARGRKPKLSPEQMHRMYDSKDVMSVKLMAGVYGVSIGTVYKTLSKMKMNEQEFVADAEVQLTLDFDKGKE